MITKRIQDLFDFIDYLDSQKEYFNSKENLILQYNDLMNKSGKLFPRDNHLDKLELDGIHERLKPLHDKIETEVNSLIKGKIKEFDIAKGSSPEFYIYCSPDLQELKRNFKKEDLELIQNAVTQYDNFNKEFKFYRFHSWFWNEFNDSIFDVFHFFYPIKDNTEPLKSTPEPLPLESDEVLKASETELSKKIKEHFRFLYDGSGFKNRPMMTSEQFACFSKIMEDYFSNNFEFTKSHEPIQTNNVTKKKFLVALKEFYKKQPNKLTTIPESLVVMANMITQDNWNKVDMINLHKASIE
jgi:hypothetical protein